MPEHRTTYLEAVSLRIVVVSFGFGEKIVVVMKSKVAFVVRDRPESGRMVDALGPWHDWPERRKQNKHKQNSHRVSTPWQAEEMWRRQVAEVPFKKNSEEPGSSLFVVRGQSFFDFCFSFFSARFSFKVFSDFFFTSFCCDVPLAMVVVVFTKVNVYQFQFIICASILKPNFFKALIVLMKSPVLLKGGKKFG